MKTFKHHITHLIITLIVTSACTIHAASVELKNGDILSGKITSFDQKTLSLTSSSANENLQIKSSNIQRVIINNKLEEKTKHNERITLINEDIIPCEVISVDQEKVNISTWYAGNFTIPRKQIQQIEFGINDQLVIYRGDDDLSNWSTRKGPWSKPSASSIAINRSGTLARKFDLPTNVRISYKLSWRGSPPNFAFRFCGATDSPSSKQDTYEFTFNVAGMQIRRHTRKSTTGTPLVSDSSLKPTVFNGRSVNLDFYVNRDAGLITLLIDGTQIGTWRDMFEATDGGYIKFENRDKNSQLTFSNILIANLKTGILPRHREPIEKSELDVFLDSTGDIYSGNILSLIKNDSGKRTMLIKPTNASAPFNVPENRISLLRFSNESKTNTPKKNAFLAMLPNYGEIKLTNPQINNNFLETRHPILGKCNINLKAISRLQTRLTQENEK